MEAQDQLTLAFYAKPGVMTSAGRFARLFDPLPRDVQGLTAIAQGLLIHEHLVSAYGVTLSDDERASVHLRRVDQLLEQIVVRDDRPLGVPREPGARLAGNCRHFTVLTAAMLRYQGTPARARCGFGGYFGTSAFEDHWVCEYWDSERQRWVLVDAQIDDRQREMFPIDFDVTDVPRDRFLIAADGWARCRSGQEDPGKFGLSLINEAGYWWIAGNLMRDAAALGNLELLPWDCWGAMPDETETIDDERAALFDRLAALTRQPDASFAELQQLCATDERLRVPPAVHNAVRRRDEPI